MEPTLPVSWIYTSMIVTACVSVFGGIIVLNKFGVGLPQAFRRRKMVGKNNIMDKAEMQVTIFTRNLHHDLCNNPEIVEQMVRALKRGVKFSIICGPTIDAQSEKVMDTLLQHRDLVSLAMIRPQYEHMVRGGISGKFRQFAVADRTHVCVEDLSDQCHAPTRHNMWIEVHDMPAIACGWLNLFDKLNLVAVPLVSTRTVDLHNEIVAHSAIS